MAKAVSNCYSPRSKETAPVVDSTPRGLGRDTMRFDIKSLFDFTFKPWTEIPVVVHNELLGNRIVHIRAPHFGVDPGRIGPRAESAVKNFTVGMVDQKQSEDLATEHGKHGEHVHGMQAFLQSEKELAPGNAMVIRRTPASVMPGKVFAQDFTDGLG